MPTLYILPLGDVGKEKLRRLGDVIKDRLSLSIRVLDSTPVPVNAYDKGRQQHDVSKIIKEVSLFDFGNIDRLLAVTDVDLYSVDLSFVFGGAEAPGRNALLSLKRLEPSFYHKSLDKDLLDQRILKEALHELGHTNNLSHCSDQQCVMYYSQSIEDVDNKGDMFCPRCWKLYRMYDA